jgi:hypothetical protein
MPVWLNKMVLAQNFLHRMHAESGKMAQQSLTPLLLLLIGWIVELIQVGCY